MDMQKIDKPCFIDGMDGDEYHGDVCVTPSLSHGGAHEIISKCPALYFERSPYNPKRVIEDERKFDMGLAAHALLLEPQRMESSVHIVQGRTKKGEPSPGYASEDAKNQREWAIANRKIPLLPEQWGAVRAMRDALYRHPIAGHAFKNGVAERSFFWQDAFEGVWLKCRPDFLYHDNDTLIHFKTTGRAASPPEMSKILWDNGCHSALSWYADGIDAVTGHRPANNFFIVQETEPPYLVSVTRIKPSAVAWGHKANRKAISIFADCLKTGEWYGYREWNSPHKDTILQVSIPTWAEYALHDADEAGAFDIPGSKVDADGVVSE
jgi:hypothetical protein